MKPHNKTFAILCMMFAMTAMLTCCKKDDTSPSTGTKTVAVPSEYAKPAIGTYLTFETFTVYLDSNDAVCNSTTQANSTGLIFVVKSDSTFELRRSDNFYLGEGGYAFVPLSGEVLIDDNIYAITAPYMSGGMSWPGHLENVRMFYGNKKIPQDTSISVTDNSGQLYMINAYEDLPSSCGTTVYKQDRLKK